jgi:hypothetical protein
VAGSQHQQPVARPIQRVDRQPRVVHPAMVDAEELAVIWAAYDGLCPGPVTRPSSVRMTRGVSGESQGCPHSSSQHLVAHCVADAYV